MRLSLKSLPEARDNAGQSFRGRARGFKAKNQKCPYFQLTSKRAQVKSRRGSKKSIFLILILMKAVTIQIKINKWKRKVKKKYSMQKAILLLFLRMLILIWIIWFKAKQAPHQNLKSSIPRCLHFMRGLILISKTQVPES